MPNTVTVIFSHSVSNCRPHARDFATEWKKELHCLNKFPLEYFEKGQCKVVALTEDFAVVHKLLHVALTDEELA